MHKNPKNKNNENRDSNTFTLKNCDWKIPDLDNKTLYSVIEENKKSLWDQEHILSLFKKVFSNSKNESFVYDETFWLQSKKDFVIKAYLISYYIKKLPWKYIWVMLPSVSSTSIIFIALHLAWKVPVMINWTLSKKSLEYCVNYTQLEYILTSNKFYSKIKNENLQVIDNKVLLLEDMLHDVSYGLKIQAYVQSIFFHIPSVHPDDPAVVLFTSWSEYFPKAISLTHANIIFDLQWALHHFPIWSKDIVLWFIPPFHSFWLLVNVIMPLVTGVRVAYTPNPYDTQSCINILKYTQANAFATTPTFLKMMLNTADKNDLLDTKYAVVGAEKCPIWVQELFQTFCPKASLLEWYWVTECSPVISINPLWKEKFWSVGLVILWWEIKIISHENWQELSPNKEGLIYYSWKNVFSWYRDPSLHNPFEIIDNKKFFKTGDMWYVDNDGYLFITWRFSRFVKIAGEMISLPFLEEILFQKYNGLVLESKEYNWELKIVLFSVKEIDRDEVSRYLKDNWVTHLVKISECIKIENIPVLWTWKIDYTTLRNMIHFKKISGEFTLTDIRSTIIKKISELSWYDESKIHEKSVFWDDIFLDSIDVWELAIFIKTYYKKIELKVFKDVKTVWDLIELLK